MSQTYTRKVIIEVPRETPISEDAVEETRYRFRSQFPFEPEEIVVHPADRYKLLALYRPDMEAQIGVETFHGMKIVVDPNQKKGEWKLTKTESNTYVMGKLTDD